MAQEVNRPPVRSKGQKRDQVWTLMRVSDDGEVQTVRDGKALRNLLLAAAVAGLIAAGTFYGLWDRARSENDALRRAVAAYRQRLTALGVDQEELSTLLAVYRPAPAAPADIPPAAPAPSESEAPPDRSRAPSEPESGTEIPSDLDAGAAPMVSPVGIEDFETALGELSGAMTIEFKVTNIDPDMEKAEGHVVIVLRPGEGGVGGGLALPPVTLIGGRPTGDEEGQAFSISNFKRIRFTAGAETQPERFKVATVFIFNESGGLWMEEDFPVRTQTVQ